LRNALQGTLLILVLALAASGCSWLRSGDDSVAPLSGINNGEAPGDTSYGPAAAADAAPSVDPPEGTPTTVAVAQSALGPILVDGQGFTLYRFIEDQAQTPTCVGPCLSSWPWLGAPGEMLAGAGVDPATITKIEREEGGWQTTCGGWPLYRYRQDQQPGDVEGHALNGAWFAVAPNCQVLSQVSAGG
jgi:predicted lipoprotein with Yx(FWY)xxD motif